MFTLLLRISFSFFSYLFAAVFDLLLDLLPVPKILTETGTFYRGVATCSPGNFSLSFSVQFLSIFVHFSGSTESDLGMIGKVFSFDRT